MNEVFAPHDWVWSVVHALPGELPTAVLVYAVMYANLPGLRVVSADARAWARRCRRRRQVVTGLAGVDAGQDLVRIEPVAAGDGAVTWRVTPLVDGLGDLRRRPRTGAGSSPRG